MSKFDFTPVIPAGETILVTGANGYIATHVADQLLAAGYRVRGTVRSPEKSKWLEELFEKSYGPGKFELVQVANIIEEGAFENAAEGE